MNSYAEKSDIDLVDESITHWERMRDDPNECGERPFADGCALCRKYFFNDFDPNVPYPEIKTDKEACEGCPIYLLAGQKHCLGTPYIAALEAFPPITWKSGSAMAPAVPEARRLEWRALAQDEIFFLRAVRERLLSKADKSANTSS